MASRWIDWANPTEVAIGGAQNLPATNELPVDMYKKMFATFPSLTPMTVIMSKMGDSPAHNYRIDWQEENEIPHTLVVATTEGSVSTNVFVVSGGSSLVQDSLLFNPRAYDLRKVAANETDNTVGVTVDQGGTTSTVWKSGDVLHVLAPSVAEDDNDVYRNVSVADDNVYNLMQLIRMNFAMTRTMNKMSTHFGGPGSKRAQLKAQKYREFRIKSEKLIYFGGRATAGTAPATIRQMGGLYHYLYNGTMWKDFNSVMTESGWRGYLGDYKDQNPDATNVFAFVAGNIMDIIDGFGINKVRLTPESKTYGLDISTYNARGLKVNLVPLPLLTDPVTRGWGFILDLDKIKLRWLDKPMFYGDAKNVGMSERIYDLYRSQMSLLIGSESSHAMFVGALT